MNMIIENRYICSHCGTEFRNKSTCRSHEINCKITLHLALYNEHGDELARISGSNPDLVYCAQEYGKQFFFVRVYDKDGSAFFNKLLEICFGDPSCDEYEPGIYLYDGHEWILLDEQIQWLEDMKEYLSR